MAQFFAAAVLVACSFAYALWTLAPRLPRARLAAALLQLPLPQCLQGPLRAAARLQGGCACDGCDRRVPGMKPSQPAGSAADAQGRAKPLVFVCGPRPQKSRSAAD